MLMYVVNVILVFFFLPSNRRPHPSRRRSKSRSRSRSRSSTPEFVSGQEDDGNGRKRQHNNDHHQLKQNAPKRQRCKDYDGKSLLNISCLTTSLLNKFTRKLIEKKEILIFQLKKFFYYRLISMGNDRYNIHCT